MPTYQYACTACDERLEIVQKFSDDPLTECAACGGRLRKVFSAAGIIFKGSGFYRTDSRGSSKSSTTSSPSPASGNGSSTDSSSTTKSESSGSSSSDSSAGSTSSSSSEKVA
ncbi:FmdB family transcriptional regulator [Actinomadura craniellae]|uniref:FmdB family transcriptional regulator n=1 Tax=Actinomadura craniellae TaxID=2231787 RepID=A0A365H7H6_9ACTN|nr:FmdB family zinc ribbon protein [Actinomadura craniellae]RAY15037.1 FmdB family transcriptional regulator [Actinomadura craniellae]